MVNNIALCMLTRDKKPSTKHYKKCIYAAFVVDL